MTEQDERERSSQVTIRSASRTDLPAIEKILRATVQTPYGSGNVEEDEVQMELEKINKTLDSTEEGQILTAKDEQGETLGFAFSGRPDPRILDFTHSDPATTLGLRLLYLDPNKRKQGVGSQLLNAVEEAAKSAGMSKIELTSGPRYIWIGSGRFYLKRGYKLVGTIPNYFEGKYWAKVFQKELGND